MRRLIVELYGREYSRRVQHSAFRNVRSLEILNFFRYDQNGFLGVCRIRLKDGFSKVEDIFKDDEAATEVQVLEREKGKPGDGEGPSFIILLKRKLPPRFLFGLNITKPEGGLLFTPFEFNDGRLRFTFVGSNRQIKEILRKVEVRGILYRIVSVTDANFAPDSLLNRLTEKQRRTLILAFKLGYYDVPKKINSDELGERLHLTGSTVVEHLGKAEHRLLAGILTEA